MASESRAQGLFRVFPVAVALFSCSPEIPHDLEVVPDPLRIEELDESAQAGHARFRAALDRAREGGDPEALATAFGELGTWFQVFRMNEQASAAYGNARRLDADELAWAYFDGWVHANLGEVDEAREAFEIAIEIRPGYVPALVRLGELELQEGRLERAEELFVAALRIYPECDRALVGSARIALEARAPERALALLEGPFERAPDAGAVRHTLVRALRESGDVEGAREILETALSRHVALRLPDPLVERLNRAGRTSRSFTNRARTLLAQGSPGEAAELLEQAVELVPERQEIRVFRGQALREAARLEEARALLEDLLRDDPGSARGHLELALTLDALGDADGASVHFRAALSEDPGLSRARQRWALHLRARGDAEGCVRETGVLLDGFPGDSRGLLLRSLCLVDLERWAEAIEAAEEAAPSSAPARRLAARLLAAVPQGELRDGPRGLRWLERDLGTVSVSEVDPVTAEVVAMAFASAGDFARAIAWQQAVVEVARDHDVSAPWAERRLDRYRGGHPLPRPFEPDERALDLPVAPPASG